MLYDAIMLFNMEIINRLQKYRLERRLTQMELADRLGVAFSTVNRWFRGHTEPNQIQTHQIKKLLKVK